MHILSYNIQGMHEFTMCERETPHLECRLFVHGSQSPSLLVTLAQSQLPI
jgi:hypothetical protein